MSAFSARHHGAPSLPLLLRWCVALAVGVLFLIFSCSYGNAAESAGLSMLRGILHVADSFWQHVHVQHAVMTKLNTQK